MVLMCALCFTCVVFFFLCFETLVITVRELLGAVGHIKDGKNHFILSDWLFSVRADGGRRDVKRIKNCQCKVNTVDALGSWAFLPAPFSLSFVLIPLVDVKNVMHAFISHTNISIISVQVLVEQLLKG